MARFSDITSSLTANLAQMSIHPTTTTTATPSNSFATKPTTREYHQWLANRKQHQASAFALQRQMHADLDALAHLGRMRRRHDVPNLTTTTTRERLLHTKYKAHKAQLDAVRRTMERELRDVQHRTMIWVPRGAGAAGASGVRGKENRVGKIGREPRLQTTPTRRDMYLGIERMEEVVELLGKVRI